MNPIIINQHLTKSTFAYQEMRRLILEGEIEPGQRLILRDIAAQLGLSIQPIRDAIKMLERDGLVDTESHRGAVVTQISGGAIIELIGVRMWLEILAVEQAVPAHTPESVQAMREALETAEQLAGGGGLSYSQANRRLHEAIEAPAPSLVRQLISDSWEHLWRERRRMSLFELEPTAGPSAQREHVDIVMAAASGDAEGAAQAMASHRESTLAAWRKALAGLPPLAL
ncbi:MAG TPA: GntR family transcriptional regulator [Streptosporangiaceae bacterium]